MATDIVFIQLVLCYISLANALPPAQCSYKFNWDDCGGPPQPVMYYWKPGSRCEVGIWRGCLPNINMFKNEYECVSTCIFSVRAVPSDFHNNMLNYEEENQEIDIDTVTTPDTTRNSSATSNTTNPEGQATNGTDAKNEEGGGGAIEGGATEEATGGETTDAAGEGTTEEATGAAEGETPAAEGEETPAAEEETTAEEPEG